MKRICVSFLLFLSCASVPLARAPEVVVVSALGNGLRETSEIRVLRFATLKEDTVVKVGDTFEVGDELISSGTVAIEIACAKGSVAKLSPPFRALMAAPKSKGEDCAVNLLAGRADILTDQPTSVESGETTAGSRATVYSVQVSRNGGDSSVTCAVLDGEVDFLVKGGTRSNLRMGSKKSWGSSGNDRVQKLTADDIKQTASLYARMDAVKAQIAGAATSASTATELEASYLRVFQTPADAEARVELAAKQINLKIAKGALYHLEKAEKAAPATDKAQLARIAAVRSVAYNETGDSTRASEQAEKARRTDPKVFESPSLIKLKIDPSRIPAARIAPSGRATPDERAAVPGPDAGRTSATAVRAPAPAATEGSKAASTTPAAVSGSTKSSVATRAGSVTAASAASSSGAVASTDVLMEMVTKGQYEQAASGFLRRLNQVGENARDAYGLALSYYRLKRLDEAKRYATVAINANDKQKQLSEDELRMCREIRAAR